LNNAHAAHEEAHVTGLAQLDSNDTWQKLTEPQRQKILADLDLAAPVKPDTGTDLTILGVEGTGYSGWFERLLAELGFELWIGMARHAYRSSENYARR
jgi:hypothetical protein